MKLLNKLERKLGRFAVPNLMYYIIIIYVLGVVIGMINPYFYAQYLALDISLVLKGQVWRLVTFLIQPRSVSGGLDLVFLFFEMYLYYHIGRSLESVWGTFRFNLYYAMGIIFNILAAFILYAFKISSVYPMGLTYINRSLFFAYATTFPNLQILLSFFIPIKVKWLGIAYGVIIAYDVIRYLFTPGYMVFGIAILVALANFLIFFLATRNYNRMSPRDYKRRANYRKKVKTASSITRHKCAVCGKTEKDDETLEFRFCSKCDGNYEYCMEHLFTHEHVKR